MTHNTEHYREKLQEEKETLEKQLSEIGVQNPDNPAEWNVKGVEFDIMEADMNEAADRAEEIEENESVLATLSTRYLNVTRALERIEKGTFGVCEISGEPIEPQRLDANPAARTCIKHLDQEVTLS